MRNLISATLTLSILSVAGWAQAPRDSWENLKQLQPGHKIKIVDKQLQSWDGKLVSVSEEAVTIQEKQKQQEITVDRPNVLRVTDLQRWNRARNALIGLAAGTATGLAISASDSWDLSGTGKLMTTCIFGGIGAGVGAAIPYPRPTIYRSTNKPEVVKAQQ